MTFKLSLDLINKILAHLSQRPYGEVVQLVEALKEECHPRNQVSPPKTEAPKDESAS